MTTMSQSATLQLELISLCHEQLKQQKHCSVLVNARTDQRTRPKPAVASWLIQAGTSRYVIAARYGTDHATRISCTSKRLLV